MSKYKNAIGMGMALAMCALCFACEGVPNKSAGGDGGGALLSLNVNVPDVGQLGAYPGGPAGVKNVEVPGIDSAGTIVVPPQYDTFHLKVMLTNPMETEFINYITPGVPESLWVASGENRELSVEVYQIPALPSTNYFSANHFVTITPLNQRILNLMGEPLVISIDVGFNQTGTIESSEPFNVGGTPFPSPPTCPASDLFYANIVDTDWGISFPSVPLEFFLVSDFFIDGLPLGNNFTVNIWHLEGGFYADMAVSMNTTLIGLPPLSFSGFSNPTVAFLPSALSGLAPGIPVSVDFYASGGWGGISSAPAPVLGINDTCRGVIAGGQYTFMVPSAPSCVIHIVGYDCGGNLAQGQMTVGINMAPVANSIASIGAGGEHSCAFFTDGTIKCWGDNIYGQLGDAASFGNCINSTPLLASATHTGGGALGGYHSAAIGSVTTWGANDKGQLGNSVAIPGANTAAPVSAGLATAIQLGLGYLHSCAVDSGGAINCWGDNMVGQLGDGSTGFYSSTPGPTQPLTGAATKVDGGDSHTCALLASGGVQCWGDDTKGQLGNDGLGSSSTPTTVIDADTTPVSLAGANDVAAGGNFACAVVGGLVRCWGENFLDQMGDGTPAGGIYQTAQTAVNITTATQVTAGYGHACALISGGQVYCWGDNTVGQLGRGTTGGNSEFPQAVSGISTAVQVAAGTSHTCALLNDYQTVVCWGYNACGMLGNGNSTDSNIPVTVIGL